MTENTRLEATEMNMPAATILARSDLYHMPSTTVRTPDAEPRPAKSVPSCSTS